MEEMQKVGRMSSDQNLDFRYVADTAVEVQSLASQTLEQADYA